MSNVINNIIKNDTTYAVQDSRVDNLKEIFYIEYGVTQWADIITHYNAGDTLKLKRNAMGTVFTYDLYEYTGVQFVFMGITGKTSSDGGMIKKITIQLNGSSTFYNESYSYIQNMLEAGSNVTIQRNEETGKDTVSATDTTYTAGSNVSISNGVISATDTTYSEASTSSSGLMSASDKVKLNGVASGASAVSVSASGTATDEVSYITINGVEKKLTGGSGSVEVDGSTIKANSQGKLAATCGAAYVENPPIPGETFTKVLMRAPQEVIEQDPDIYEKAAIIDGFDSSFEIDTISASFGNITIEYDTENGLVVTSSGTEYTYSTQWVYRESTEKYCLALCPEINYEVEPPVPTNTVLWDALATNQSATVKEEDTPVDPTVSYINDACINPESWQKILTSGNGIELADFGPTVVINNTGVTSLGNSTGNIMLADDVYFNDDNWFGTIYGGAKEIEQVFDEPMQTDIVGTFYEQEYDPETGYGPAKYNVTTALSTTTINFLKSIQDEEKKVALNVYINSGEYAGDCIGNQIVCTCSSDGVSEWFFEGFVDIDYAEVPFELRLFYDNTAKLILDQPNIHDVPIYGDVTSLKIDVMHTYEATAYTPIDSNFVPLAAGLPAAPTTDGNYVLKCSIVSGVATYSWVAQA